MSTDHICKGCDEQFTNAQAAGFVQGFCHDCTERRINDLMAETRMLRDGVERLKQISFACRTRSIEPAKASVSEGCDMSDRERTPGDKNSDADFLARCRRMLPEVEAIICVAEHWMNHAGDIRKAGVKLAESAATVCQSNTPEWMHCIGHDLNDFARAIGAKNRFQLRHDCGEFWFELSAKDDALASHGGG